MAAMGHATARVLRAGLILLCAVAMAGLAGLLVLAWRLSQGPLDVDWAAQKAVAVLNAGNPGSAVTLGHATLQWRGFAEGPGRAIEVHVASARIDDGTRQAVAMAGPMAASLSVAGLLHGEVAPESVQVAGLDLHLVRGTDGVRLDGPPRSPPSGTPSARLQQVLAGLTRKPEGQGAVPGLHGLERLRTLRVDTLAVTVEDQVLGTTERLAVDVLDAQRQGAGGVRGTAAGTVSVGEAHASLSLQADLAPDGGTRLQLTMAPVQASAVRGALPDLAVPDALHAPVGGSATLSLSPALQPLAATLHADAGPGTVQVRDKVIAFDSAAADAEATWTDPGWTRPARVSIPRAVAIVRAPGGPTTLTGSLQAQRTGDTVATTAELALDQVAFADLPALWPNGVSPHVRPWLTENVTAGVARDASVRLELQGPADLSSVRLVAVDGRLTGDDLTVHWLRPVPPLEHGAALLTITAPDTLDITIPSARQGGLTLRNGTVHITGLDVKDQFMAIGLDVAGPLPDLLALLNNKRLNLLNKHPLPMRSPAGTLAGHLTVDFPLNHDLRFDQVAIGTHAHFTNVHLGGLVAGRDLDGGDVTLDANVDGLKASGRARVGGVPGQLAVSMDFRDGPPNQLVLNAEATARATARQLAGAGLDPGSLMTAGAVAVTARYEEQRDGAARLHATADMRDAGLAVAGWRKPPGPPAHGSATVVLDHGHLLGIEALQATGPGLELDGHVRTVNERPLDLILNRIVLGATHATGEVRFPATEGGPIVVRLSGPVLDLSTQFGTPPAEGPPTELKDNRGTPFDADIRFDRVVLAHGNTVSAVTGHVAHDGRKITALHVVTGAPEQVTADIRPDGTGRRLTLRAADGGAALRALDVTDTVRGGALVADARYDDTRPLSPLSGQAELTGFHVGTAVAVGKVLQALTLYGVLDALNGPGVLFDRLLLPFRWEGDVLHVNGARAFSSSLGLTAEGTVDSGRHQLDLHGTVVPAYVVNSALGRIPLVGRLFSPEKGSGLVAMDWSVRGPIADPAVRANPLSLLTPGILRNLFHIFD